jgi:signal transduction histidine kinase
VCHALGFFIFYGTICMMQPFSKILKRLRSADLQVKVIVILVAVIFPISFILGLVQSKVLEPVLHDEVRQVGVSFAQNLGSQIETNRLLLKANATQLIEDRIQRMMYTQPSVIRVDVITMTPTSHALHYIASNVEDQEAAVPPIDQLKQETTVELSREEGIPVWSIFFPISNGFEKANVHVLVSLRMVGVIQATTLKINLVGALLSTIFLILVLSFFLRRVIENEKQLKVAQMSNEVLSEKLQEMQQELIHTEKLAVMGQLTASFAHEIGTPLNAIGGHVQLLNMDLQKTIASDRIKPVEDRLGIISGQLRKIEDIVKGFLQTTKKPIIQQKSLVQVRDLVERIVALVIPTLQRHQISFGQEFNATIDWVEVVPLEIEQVILNLVNNAIDSMKEKTEARAQTKKTPVASALWLRTYNDVAKKTITIEIQDTGMGISTENLKQIFKPFFTTKSAGEGHGLGLAICQQILRAYGGEVLVESKVGKGTWMKIQLPLSEKGKV